MDRGSMHSASKRCRSCCFQTASQSSLGVPVPDHREYRLPHHVLTFRNLCGKEWYSTLRYAVRSVAPAVGILDWAESSIHDVEELRNAAFRLIRSRNLKFRKSFRRYFRLNEIVQL